MKLVVLPGNSKSNREWAEKTAHAFSGLFSDQYVQSYSHWDEGGDTIDFEVETRKLAKNIEGNECFVVAKSAGAMLAIRGVSKNLINPTKCVFFGLPILWAQERGFNLKEWIQEFDVPTIIIQNSNDPVTPYSEVRRFIDEFYSGNLITLIETDGNDHKYDDMEKMMRLIGNFLS